jgi:hypothetical protein
MEPTAAEVFFQDWDSLVVARERLLTEGWTVEPEDSPETGVRGFSAYRESTGERTSLKWACYGRVLTTVVKVVATWQEFLTELEFRKDEDMEKADSLGELQVGFATYGRAATSGVAEVTRISVEALQAGGVEARSRLIRLLTSSKHPGAALLKQVAGSQG